MRPPSTKSGSYFGGWPLIVIVNVNFIYRMRLPLSKPDPLSPDRIELGMILFDCLKYSETILQSKKVKKTISNFITSCHETVRPRRIFKNYVP